MKDIPWLITKAQIRGRALDTPLVGNLKVVTSHDLLGCNVRSCNCLRTEICSANGKKVDRTNVIAAARKANITHGHTVGSKDSRTYASYKAMYNRCYRPKTKSYREYGGRGIVVCQFWLDSFVNFLKDMGERPEGTTLDRINVNGNYEPSNCRWSSPLVQTLNRRPVAAVENLSDDVLIVEFKKRFPQVNLDILADDCNLQKHVISSSIKTENVAE